MLAGALSGKGKEKMTKELMLEKLAAINPASAWRKGVKIYAVELMEESELSEGDFDNVKLLEKALLNGAQDWTQYSEGGCSLVYDADIAERLCTPSELKKKDGGRLDPNKSEGWIGVQSRAIRQAWSIIKRNL